MTDLYFLDTRAAYALVILCSSLLMYGFVRTVFPREVWAKFFSLGLASLCLGHFFAIIELLLSGNSQIPPLIVLFRFLFFSIAPYLIYIGGKAFLNPPVFDERRQDLMGFVRSEFSGPPSNQSVSILMLAIPVIIFVTSPWFFQIPAWFHALYGLYFFFTLLFFGFWLKSGQPQEKLGWLVSLATIILGLGGCFYGFVPLIEDIINPANAPPLNLPNLALTLLLFGELIMFLTLFLVLQNAVRSWVPSDQGEQAHLADLLLGITNKLGGGCASLFVRIPGEEEPEPIWPTAKNVPVLGGPGKRAIAEILSGEKKFTSFLDTQNQRQTFLPIIHKGGVIACFWTDWADQRIITATTWQTLKIWSDQLGPLLHASRQQKVLILIAQDIEKADTENLGNCDQPQFLKSYIQKLAEILKRRLSPKGLRLSWDLGYVQVSIPCGQMAVDLISEVHTSPGNRGKIELAYSWSNGPDPAALPCLAREPELRQEISTRIGWALDNVLRSRFNKVRQKIFTALAGTGYTKPETWLKALIENLDVLENIQWVGAVLPQTKVWENYYLRLEAAGPPSIEMNPQQIVLKKTDHLYLLGRTCDLEKLAEFAKNTLQSSDIELIEMEDRQAAGFELEKGCVLWIGLMQSTSQNENASWLQQFKGLSQAAAPALLRIESWLRSLELQDLNGKIRRRNMSSIDMHQLRGHLNAMDNSIGLIDDYSYYIHDDKKEEYLKNLKDLQEIKKLLITLVTRIATTRHVAEKETDLAQVFELLRQSEAPKCVIKDISLELPPDSNPMVVAVSFDITFAVLQELVTNAIKAAGQGGKIKISLSTKGNAISCQVQDNGSGIDPALQDSVFDLGVSTSTDGGLGLWAVRHELRREKGDIGLVHSEPGNTRFEVTLPRAG